MKNLIVWLKSAVVGLLFPKTQFVRRPDRALMIRYGAMKLKHGRGAYVEIGAGAGGNAALMFDGIGADRARGHLIEACPRNFDVLRNKVSGFRLHNFAVAARDGSIPFYVFDKEGWEGSSLSNATDLEYLKLKFPQLKFEEIAVPAKRLDTFLDEAKIDRVDFAIFNCEGSEYEIFSGDLSFLRRVDLFYVDLHGKIALTPELVAKKRAILAAIEREGFVAIGGSLPSEVETVNGHLSFLFEREN